MEIITAQIQENLSLLGDVEKIKQEISDGPDLADDSEEVEDFHQSQRTQKFDDFDQFSKLMRQKLEGSIPLLLERFTVILQNYEQALGQVISNNNDMMLKI